MSAVGPGASFCHLGGSSSGSSRGNRPAGQVLVLPPGAQADSGFRPFLTRGEDTLFVETKGTAIKDSNDKEMKIYDNFKKTNLEVPPQPSHFGGGKLAASAGSARRGPRSGGQSGGRASRARAGGCADPRTRAGSHCPRAGRTRAGQPPERRQAPPTRGGIPGWGAGRAKTPRPAPRPAPAAAGSWSRRRAALPLVPGGDAGERAARRGAGGGRGERGAADETGSRSLPLSTLHSLRAGRCERQVSCRRGARPPGVRYPSPPLLLPARRASARASVSPAEPRSIVRQSRRGLACIRPPAGPVSPQPPPAPGQLPGSGSPWGADPGGAGRGAEPAWGALASSGWARAGRTGVYAAGAHAAVSATESILVR